MLFVIIGTKAIAIKYMYTKKVFMSLLTKPIPSDMFKIHMLSLGIRKVQFQDISCHVMDCNEQNAHNLLLHVRHIEMSQAYDWPNHIGNHPDA